MSNRPIMDDYLFTHTHTYVYNIEQNENSVDTVAFGVLTGQR